MTPTTLRRSPVHCHRNSDLGARMNKCRVPYCSSTDSVPSVMALEVCCVIVLTDANAPSLWSPPTPCRHRPHLSSSVWTPCSPSNRLGVLGLPNLVYKSTFLSRSGTEAIFHVQWIRRHQTSSSPQRRLRLPQSHYQADHWVPYPHLEGLSLESHLLSRRRWPPLSGSRYPR